MNTGELKHLILVYNAHSGIGNSLLDSAHKIMSPSTYDCRLCSLTYGAVRERKEWKLFRERSTIPMIFYHKDEFLRVYASKFAAKFTFPIILAETGEDLEVLVTTTELNAIEDTSVLIEIVKFRMKS